MSELRSELWEKEMKLTDIRLEALNSAHQLEQLRETMHNMQVRTTARSPAGSEHQGGHRPCTPQPCCSPGMLPVSSSSPSAVTGSLPAGGGPPEG